VIKRHFTKRQRNALERASGGLCSLCGIRLPLGWHADHKIPFSKDGATDVLNGQALCPRCNLKKGNKMKQPLRTWQTDAVEETLNNFSDGQFSFLCHATPGAGKTVYSLEVFDRMRQQGVVTHGIFLSPRAEIQISLIRDAERDYGIKLKPAMLYDGQADFHDYDGIVITYQSMNNWSEDLRIFCGRHRTLVVGDELHHVTDGQTWGEAFRHAFEPARNLLALTGTPWGANGGKIAFINYNENGFAIPDYSYGKEQAIRDKVCRITQMIDKPATDIRFVNNDTGEVTTHTTLEDAVADPFVPDAYLKVLESPKLFKDIFILADEDLTSYRKTMHNAGGLIVAPNIRTANLFRDELILLTGKEYPIVHSKTEKAPEIIKKFRESRDEWLISVDMVTEGVDIKRLMVCIFLSAKNTQLFLRQVMGRIERRIGSLDSHASFYYVKYKPLEDEIGQIRKENEAGEKALDEEGDSEDTPRADNPTGKLPDNVTLQDLETEIGKLTALGYTFPPEIVAEALSSMRSSRVPVQMPLFHWCIAVASRNNMMPTAEEDDPYFQSHTEKINNVRKVIAKLINKRLFNFFGRQPTGKEIATAHNRLNNVVGITETNDDTPLVKLEQKLEVATTSEVSSWVS
jgi:superfamily II DNA or RNA helicase